MEQAVRRRISARKLTILLLLAAKDESGAKHAPISGTTRMQKLVFLVKERTEDLIADEETFTFDFQFDADRFGPADLNIYPDLELLKAAGWLNVDGETGIPSAGVSGLLDEPQQRGQPILPEEQEEVEGVSFEYLMGEMTEEADLAEAENGIEPIYEITEKGLHGLDQISSQTSKADKFRQLAKACEEVKVEVGSWPLSHLLRFVYKNYPETTVRSEIRRQVLGT